MDEAHDLPRRRVDARVRLHLHILSHDIYTLTHNSHTHADSLPPCAAPRARRRRGRGAAARVARGGERWGPWGGGGGIWDRGEGGDVDDEAARLRRVLGQRHLPPPPRRMSAPGRPRKRPVRPIARELPGSACQPPSPGPPFHPPRSPGSRFVPGPGDAAEQPRGRRGLGRGVWRPRGAPPVDSCVTPACGGLEWYARTWCVRACGGGGPWRG